ncbi:Phosphatidylinositol kinase [Globisporangium polare]
MFQVFTNWNEQSGTSRNVPLSSPPSKIVGGSSSSHAPQHQSPTAAFYSKLKQYGITDVSPNQRQHWPVSVLKQVYLDLVAQRPRNVLQQEISLGSGDLRESWSKSARLSKSLAVMSALGYIIGLGDRHLDNILLCKKSGDVLHIDYNVCFDKGLKLKVPEIVPFRLTPMLQDALGLTGVEGKFRVAFETTLRVMRGNDARESLLTLLEAFVYDPLVDWTADETRRGGSEDLKTRLEVNVNLSLFLSRAEERRHEATVFEHQLDAQLSGLSGSIDAVTVEMSDLFIASAELSRLEQQEEMLLAEMTSLADKLSEYEPLQTRSFPECSAAGSKYEEIKAKLSGFANQCRSRHQQIEVWRNKSPLQLGDLFFHGIFLRRCNRRVKSLMLELPI